jgi:hypothetical protein
MARKSTGPKLLEKYERALKKRVVAGEIKEITLRTYLNDANRVLESLVAALSKEEILKIHRGQGYKGDYRNIIRDLKAIIKC